MDQQRRLEILVEIAKHTGRQVSAAFLKRTANFIPGIERLHNLITGIFKPAWSDYALSIVVKIDSPYGHKDEVIFLEYGRWLMTYSPRVGGLNIPDNKALVKCMDERIPLAVFKQITEKRDRQYGSTYLVLGLGMITGYDPSADVFIVESVDQPTLEAVTGVIEDEETEEREAIIAGVRRYAPLYVNYVISGFWTGWRPNEACALKWHRVDFQHGKILIREGRVLRLTGIPKSAGSIRDLDMLAPVHEASVAQKALSWLLGDYVFLGGKQKPVDQEIFRMKVWEPVLRRLGIRYRPPYQMRHTFATLAISAGENINWGARMLGHKSPVMTLERYNRFVPNLTRTDGKALLAAGLTGERFPVVNLIQ